MTCFLGGIHRRHLVIRGHALFMWRGLLSRCSGALRKGNSQVPLSLRGAQRRSNPPSSLRGHYAGDGRVGAKNAMAPAQSSGSSSSMRLFTIPRRPFPSVGELMQYMFIEHQDDVYSGSAVNIDRNTPFTFSTISSRSSLRSAGS